jgi:hypothetical protein
MRLLKPVVEKGKSQQCSDSLLSILNNAAQFGWRLFSQPSMFTFVWREDDTAKALYPGLVQITNDDGEILSQGRFLTQPLQE